MSIACFDNVFVLVEKSFFQIHTELTKTSPASPIIANLIRQNQCKNLVGILLYNYYCLYNIRLVFVK